MDQRGMDGPYNEDYYLRGEEKGISNYTDYRWMKDRTMPMAKRLIEVMGVKPGHTFLDIGCALGFTVKALRRLGVDAWGQDISKWAVKNCDPEVSRYVHNEIQHTEYDHVLMKDLTEHLHPRDLGKLISRVMLLEPQSVLIVVPLSEEINGPYVRAEDNKDVTHVIRWPLQEWMRFLHQPCNGEDYVLTGSWHIPGLKPTSLSHLGSCGFISIRRYSGPESE